MKDLKTEVTKILKASGGVMAISPLRYLVRDERIRVRGSLFDFELHLQNLGFVCKEIRTKDGRFTLRVDVSLPPE